MELVLYTAPFNVLYEADEETQRMARRQRMFNYIGEYAKENDLRYYNLFYELPQLALSGEEDWMDRQHLNCFGQEKLTRYMVQNGYLDY